MSKDRKKTSVLTLRISEELRARVDRAQAELPYKPTITSIVERGFELALVELEEITASLKAARK